MHERGLAASRRTALALLLGSAGLAALGGCAGLAAGVFSGTRKSAANAYLAAEHGAISHFDPGQSDVMPHPVARGLFHADLQTCPRIVRGPVNLMTAASTSPDYMWGRSSEGVVYIDVRSGGFREVARANAPGQAPISEAMHRKALGQRFTDLAQVERAVRDDYGFEDWTRIANGLYGLVDCDNVVYYPNRSGALHAFGLIDPADPAAGIRIVKSRDFRPMLAERESLTGMGLTYDGKIVIVGTRSLSVVDRSFEGEPVRVVFGADERISNSIAVDDRNGIYVASDKYMRKLVWTGSRLSQDEADGAWSAAYDSGREPPNIKLGTGTGSTPTLMGFGDDDADKLVVITDGADRMKLVAFWRDGIPANARPVPGAKSERIAGQVAVTCGLSPLPEFVQSEQSVVVDGYGAFVVNNIGEGTGAPNRLVDVLALGPVFAPPRGCERFEWDPRAQAWRSVWTRPDLVSTSMVPTKSAPSGIVLVNGYTPADGWEVTGMDWNTGQTVHRTIFGQDNLGNGAYAIIQLFADGDLLFNSIGGPIRVPLPAA